MNDQALARFTRILGPRDGALRTACRRLVMTANCAKHGVRLKFHRNHIDLLKAGRVMRIATHHFDHASFLARYFENYFSIVSDGRCRSLVDYSEPKLHRYADSGLEFELSSFPEEASAIESYFQWYKPKLGDIVFDIGAYCGVSSYYFSQAVGMSGKVYAFEPDPLNFGLLNRNIARHRLANVIPLQLAISSKSGVADFIGDGSLGSTLVAHTDRVADASKCRVETLTLEEACNSYGVPSFAKIDIEGSEIAVLSAAQKFLESNRIQFVLDTNHVVAGKLTNRAIEEIFRASNYEVESSDQCGFMTTWARPRNMVSYETRNVA